MANKKSIRKRRMIEGVRVSCTFDHEPTKRELEVAFNKAYEIKVKNNATKSAIPGTIKDFALKYIEKHTELRQTTIKGYNSTITNTPEWFLSTDINKITNELLSEVVDEYWHSTNPKGKFKNREARSPKTVHSFYSFYHSVIHEFRPLYYMDVELPPLKKHKPYEPSTKDVRRILEYNKNNERYYLPLKLASIGLRREEVCALTNKDLNEDNVLTINKACIVDKINNQVIEPYTKTDASNRRILVPEDIAKLIRQKEKVFDGNMHTINEHLHKCQRDLEIPDFNLHILRHFAAAYLLKNRFTTPQIEDYMGWEHGTKTMERVYSYNLDPEETQAPIANVFLKLD